MEDVTVRLFPANVPRLIFPWSGEAPINERFVANMALDAIDALCPKVFQPLVVGLEMICVDSWGFSVGPAAFPEERAWRLQDASVPQDIALPARFSRGPVRTVPTISREVLSKWLEDACAQPPTGGADHVSWSLLSVPACRARVFDSEHIVGRDFIEVDAEVGILKARLDWRADELWLSGPLRPLPDKPPLSLSLMRDDVGLLLSVNAFWSPWTEEGSPERTAINAALAHLLTRGWERESEE